MAEPTFTAPETDATKERPILFSAPMVRALLAGTKTQTRRKIAIPKRGAFVLRGDDEHDDGGPWWPYQSDDGESDVCDDGCEHRMDCPYGMPGDRLWVRENFAPTMLDGVYQYAATGGLVGTKWKPSIHMPRAACRILLEITAVRVERLQDISQADAQAEGTPCYVCGGALDGRSEADCHCFHHRATAADYRGLWEAINGDGSWEANPWVWCVSFRRAAAIDSAILAQQGGKK